MCIHLIPPSCFCLCTPPQFCLYYCIIYQSPSHSFHLPNSIPFISSTNIPFIHFIYHSPSLSYLPYLVMLMLHCHSALLSRYIKKHDFCLNILIHELISRLMHQSLISWTRHGVRSEIQKNQGSYSNSWSFYHHPQSSDFTICKSTKID